MLKIAHCLMISVVPDVHNKSNTRVYMFKTVKNRMNFVDKSSQLGFLLYSVFQCLVFIRGSKILPVGVSPGHTQT